MIGISLRFDFKAKDPPKPLVKRCSPTLRMGFAAARRRTSRQPHVHHSARKLVLRAALTKSKERPPPRPEGHLSFRLSGL
jgi:hypothetical protein